TLLFALAACTPTVQVAVPNEPININLNVKIEHEIISGSTNNWTSCSAIPAVCFNRRKSCEEYTMKYLTFLKLSLCSLLFVVSLPLMAMTLQQAMSNLGTAKEQGLVGEQPDGYLGVVSAGGDAAEIVQLIN